MATSRRRSSAITRARRQAPTETVTVAALRAAVDRVSPFRLAASWDNVGLLLGDPASTIARVILTIDLTEAVLDEALQAPRGTREARSLTTPRAPTTAVVTYHPPIFEPIRSFSAESAHGALLLRAARGLAGVIAPHTALDAVAGGVCDWLAEGLGEGLLAPLDPTLDLPTSEACMVMTKAPRDAIDRLRDAMSLAGAGRIGAYERCSFEVHGQGTFVGAASARPAVGRTQRFERVEESKLEMVASKSVLPSVLSALRAAHPYEEPPIEVTSLAARPSVREGHGRMLALLKPVTTQVAAARVARHLGIDATSIEMIERPVPRGARASHRLIGICPGSGASLLHGAIERGCTLFVTGEMKHHERLDALARGCEVLLAGHTETERGYLPRYRTQLMRALGGVPIECSRADRPPARRSR